MQGGVIEKNGTAYVWIEESPGSEVSMPVKQIAGVLYKADGDCISGTRVWIRHPYWDSSMGFDIDWINGGLEKLRHYFPAGVQQDNEEA